MTAAVPMRSIRSRLLRALTLWALLWCGALALAVWLAVREETDELLDDTLQATAAVLMGPLKREAVAGAESGAAPEGTAAATGGPRFVWQQVSHAGPARVLRHSVHAPAAPLLATPSPGFSSLPEWRIYGVALGREGQLLYVAQTTRERGEAMAELGLAVLLAGLPMGLLGLLWLRVRVGQELAPLQALSMRLADHDPLQPGATLGPAQHAELQTVHQAIDALAGRLVQRVAQERAFTAHAAHALRTPLAGIDAQLAVALREAPPALRPRLQRVRDAATRLQRVVVGLLTLFRSGVELRRVPLNLQVLVERLAPEGLAVRVLATHPVSGDADLLTAALLNLLDNAQRHGAHEVLLSTPAPELLRLHDDGEGADAARRQAWQQALDSQDYQGRTGLGLMLADLVARAHGGRLHLATTATGFALELDLGARRTDSEG
jgi:signal transduction histidine kinase